MLTVMQTLLCPYRPRQICAGWRHTHWPFKVDGVRCGSSVDADGFVSDDMTSVPVCSCCRMGSMSSISCHCWQGRHPANMLFSSGISEMSGRFSTL